MSTHSMNILHDSMLDLVGSDLYGIYGESMAFFNSPDSTTKDKHIIAWCVVDDWLTDMPFDNFIVDPGLLYSKDELRESRKNWLEFTKAKPS